MKIVESVINGQSVTIAFDENSIHVFNAYPIKDDLKIRGYRFDPAKKSWYIIPSDVDKELNALNTSIGNCDGDDIAPPSLSEDEKESQEGFPESYTILQLRNKIERAVKATISGRIWIRGIVASEVKNYKWFSYFDLKDEDEGLNIFFSVEAKKPTIKRVDEKLKKAGVSEKLDKDLPVFVQADVKISVKNQVNVRLELLDIMPEYTRSKIKNKLDITIEKLKSENIFNLQKQLELPTLIKNVALITSEQGTSVMDIMAAVYPYERRLNVFFVDSRMEGESTIESVVRNIDFFENHPSIKFDCIIIARGGGSEQSLSIFNEYEICRRVCLSRIPVITAIGHEKDQSAIELCSFLTPIPSTPSGVGKFLSNRFRDTSTILGEIIGGIMKEFLIIQKSELEKVKSLLAYIPVLMRSVVKLSKDRLEFNVKQIESRILHSFDKSASSIKYIFNSLLSKIYGMSKSESNEIKKIKTRLAEQVKVKSNFEDIALKKLIKRIDLSARKREIETLSKNVTEKYDGVFNIGYRLIDRENMKVRMYMELSDSNDPNRILKKGFTLTLDENEKAITSIENFKKCDKKKLKFFDGMVFIEEKEEK